ncbi:MAG: GNAT family N-acetyltransferase [Pseudomonadota bacterium]
MTPIELDASIGEMSNISIRHATAEDARLIASLHCASWRETYRGILDQAFLDSEIEQERLAVWSKRLRNPDSSQIVLIAHDDAEPVGFVCAFTDTDVRWGSMIDNLHVKAGLRGQGVGEYLLRTTAQTVAATTETQGLHLWVFEANEAALRFYLRMGGEVVEREKSEIPAAHEAPALRMFWPDLASLKP